MFESECPSNVILSAGVRLRLPQAGRIPQYKSPFHRRGRLLRDPFCFPAENVRMALEEEARHDPAARRIVFCEGR